MKTPFTLDQKQQEVGQMISALPDFKIKSLKPEAQEAAKEILRLIHEKGVPGLLALDVIAFSFSAGVVGTLAEKLNAAR